MDHRPDDPLNDSALEREIEAVLAVEPSAEFLARVRTHIAEQPSRSAWRVLPRLWPIEPLFALGVLGIVLLIVIPSWLRREQPSVVEQPVASTSPAQQPRVAIEPVRPEPDAPSNVTVRSVRLQPDHRLARRSASDQSRFPEVLISESDQRALALLLTRVEQDRLPPPPAVSDSGQVASADRPAIEIPDLVIEPLPQIAQLAIGERP